MCKLQLYRFPLFNISTFQHSAQCVQVLTNYLTHFPQGHFFEVARAKARSAAFYIRSTRLLLRAMSAAFSLYNTMVLNFVSKRGCGFLHKKCDGIRFCVSKHGSGFVHKKLDGIRCFVSKREFVLDFSVKKGLRFST